MFTPISPTTYVSQMSTPLFPFPCHYFFFSNPQCFSRQDSLVRHHRLLHEKSKSDKKLLHIESLAAGPRGKNISMACVRCSSISVPCDGQQPCERCLANHGGESCVYAPSSSPLTIGAATAKSLKRTKKQQRHQQQQLKEEGSPSHIEDSTFASENVPWATFGHGRRDTVSSVASGWSDATSTTSPIFQTGMDDLPASAWGPQHLQSNMPPFYEQQAQLQHWQQQQLHAQQMDGLHQSANGHMAHPFDMPEMESSTSVPPAANGNATNFAHGAGQVQESMDMDADDLSMPHLMSLIGYSGQETPMARNQGAHHAAAMPNIDWNSMLQNLAQEGRFSHNHAQGSQQGFDDGLSHEHGLPGQSDGDKQPFSGAASDKDLNATLFNAMDQSSNYSSPAVAGLHPSQVQQPHPTGALSFDVSSACNGMAANGVATQQPPQQEQQPSHQQGDVVSLAALGIPIPPMLNISLPANLQMSADNWDSFMRCLSSHAVGRQGNAPATHHSVSAVESGLHNAVNTSAQA